MFAYILVLTNILIQGQTMLCYEQLVHQNLHLNHYTANKPAPLEVMCSKRTPGVALKLSVSLN
jgi:hypothetical protein